MSEILGDRLGHLPDVVSSRRQVLMWVNAIVWELGLPVESILNEDGLSRVAGFNWIEKSRFRSFVAQANELDPGFLERAIREEAMAKLASEESSCDCGPAF